MLSSWFAKWFATQLQTDLQKHNESVRCHSRRNLGLGLGLGLGESSDSLESRGELPYFLAAKLLTYIDGCT